MINSFRIHDPTQKDRQGEDTGPQYRSVLFWKHPQELDELKEALKMASARYTKPIETTVEHYDEFYPAEEYHQDYFYLNPHVRGCETHYIRTWADIEAASAS